jgi:hypothetical protein
MIINSLKVLTQLPEPALGLLPAIHDADVEDFLLGSTLPAASAAKGRVFLNKTEAQVVMPPSGRWPARGVAPGELFGSDGRLFYSLVPKVGTTSFYPKSFERNIYTLSFTPSNFQPGGEDVILQRYFYFRLIGNNTSAVWSVIFEAGVRQDDVDPTRRHVVEAELVSGSATVSISDPLLARIGPRMVVTGSGIRDGLETTYVKSIDLEGGTAVLSLAATQSGVRTLTFAAPPGPNIGGITWLPPILEQQIFLTDVRSENGLGIVLSNSRDITIDTNELGYSGKRFIYDSVLTASKDSMPTRTTFLLRVRIGQFDTENSVADPKGYAAYVVRGPEDREPM